MAGPDARIMSTSPSGSVPAAIRTSEEVLERFGIDCGEGMHWKGWQVGGDHVKNLRIKNVGAKSVKLRYKLPATKFFYMQYPELLTLSPGMHVHLSVHFRPITEESYSDFIEFVVEGANEKFLVPVIATVPFLRVEFEEALIFEDCPVNETMARTFAMSNTGELAAPFQWRAQPPFTFTPKAGVLGVGKRQLVTVCFNPTHAACVDARVECMIGSTQKRALHIVAVSKYPFISLDETQLTFGDTYTGSVETKTVILRNQSLVRAAFKIQPVESDRPPVFAITPEAAVIPPGGFEMLTVTFTPTATGTFSCDNFEFLTPGGNTAMLTCSGTAVGPVLSFDTASIYFGDIMLGDTAKRELRLQNHSGVPLQFQFTEDERGTFNFEPFAGTMKPHSSIPVNVRFDPARPINYCKRVFCLIKDQEPLGIDLIGTCFSNATRPAPLLQKHVDAYRRRCLSGLRRLAPHELQELIDAKDALLEPAGDLREPPQYEQFFLDGSDRDTCEASMDDVSLDFGGVVMGHASAFKLARVRNHTAAKMTVAWDVPERSSAGDFPLFSVFPPAADIPPHSVIEFRVCFRPDKHNYYYCQKLKCYCYFKQNRSFRLVNEDTFAPPISLFTIASGHTFGPRDVHFLPDASFSAPKLDYPGCPFGGKRYITVALTNQGDTPLAFRFRQPKQLGGHFAVKPSIGLVPTNDFQLLCVEFTPGPAAENVSSREYSHVFRCVVNYSDELQLRVWGMGFRPSARLDSDRLYFKPTSRGMLSRATSVINSTSRIPAQFRWAVPPQFSQVLRVTPSVGVLQANERLKVTWEFVPQELRTYLIKIPCFITALDGDLVEAHLPTHEQAMMEPHQRQVGNRLPGEKDMLSEEGELLDPEAVEADGMLVLRAKGECSDGAVAMEPKRLHLGTVQTGQPEYPSSGVLTLRNQSDVTLRYRLEVRQVLPAPDKLERVPTRMSLDNASLASAFTDTSNSLGLSESRRLVDFMDDDAMGELPARCTKLVTLLFRPRYAVPHEFVVRCTFRGKKPGFEPAPDSSRPRSRLAARLDAAKEEAERQDTTEQPEQELVYEEDHVCECRVTANASFPQIKITDVRMENDENSTVASYRSRLSILDVNTELLTPQTKVEEHLNTRRGVNQFYRAGDLMRQLKSFNFNVGVGPLHSRSKTVYLQLENCNELDVKWTINFPEDMDVPLEHWADMGDPSRRERWQRAIADRNVFMVSPRSGSLKSGQRERLKVTYRHAYRGRHELPISLAIEHGKQITLNLIGETVDVMPPLFSLTSAFAAPDARDLNTQPRLSHMATHIPLHHTFKAMPLGMPLGPDQVPVQTFQLVNDSQWPLRYKLDLTQLEQSKIDNYGVEIFQCLNPIGTVPAMGRGYVRWLFRPLEAKSYSVSVPMEVAGAKQSPQVVIFHGRGIGPTEMPPVPLEPYLMNKGPNKVLPALPSHQTMLCPGQMGILSSDELPFGDLPLRAVARRIITLTNTTERDVYFCWENLPVTGRFPDHMETCWLSFQPAKGCLQPGESLMMRARLSAGSHATLLDREVQCVLSFMPAQHEAWREDTPPDDEGQGPDRIRRLRPAAQRGVDYYGEYQTPGDRLAKRLSVSASGSRGNSGSGRTPHHELGAQPPAQQHIEKHVTVVPRLKLGTVLNPTAGALRSARGLTARSGVDSKSTHADHTPLSEEKEEMVSRSLDALAADGLSTRSAEDSSNAQVQDTQRDFFTLKLHVTASVRAPVPKGRADMCSEFAVEDSSVAGTQPSTAPTTARAGVSRSTPRSALPPSARGSRGELSTARSMLSSASALSTARSNRPISAAAGGVEPAAHFVPPVRAQSTDSAPVKVDAATCESVETLLGTLLRETLASPEVSEVFGRLPAGEVPLFDPSLGPMLPQAIAEFEKAARAKRTPEEDETRAALVQPDFQSTLREVLHETVFNLMAEAHHGDWDLSRVARGPALTSRGGLRRLGTARSIGSHSSRKSTRPGTNRTRRDHSRHPSVGTMADPESLLTPEQLQSMGRPQSPPDYISRLGS